MSRSDLVGTGVECEVDRVEDGRRGVVEGVPSESETVGRWIVEGVTSLWDELVGGEARVLRAGGTRLISPGLLPRFADVVGHRDVFVEVVFRPEMRTTPPDQCIDVGWFQATLDLGPFSIK